MNKNTVKSIRGLLIFAAVLVVAVLHLEKVLGAIGIFIGMLSPFIIGGALAFVLNMPMTAIENKIFLKKGPKRKWKRALSLILALLLVVLIIWAVYMLILPQLGKTVRELAVKIPAFINEAIAALVKVFDTNPQLQEYFKSLDFNSWDWNHILTTIANALGSGIGSVVISTVNVATSIFGVVFDVVIAFVFAIYILMQKETLGSQRDRVFRAYLPDAVCNRIQKVLRLLYKNFTGFISSQCLEAVILGMLFVIVMSIFRFPYALLIGTLIAVTALVPIVGAFIGCIIGAFLILVENPILAVSFVIMFLVLQQIEGNLIYPRVVGNSVGLPAIWVLVAVSVGGSLFGVIGMLIFIPIVSTLYTLLREDVNERNTKKTKKYSSERNKTSVKKGNAGKGQSGKENAGKEKNVKESIRLSDRG